MVIVSARDFVFVVDVGVVVVGHRHRRRLLIGFLPGRYNETSQGPIVFPPENYYIPKDIPAVAPHDWTGEGNGYGVRLSVCECVCPFASARARARA